MPRTTHRLTAFFATVGLALTGIVAAGGAASATQATPGPVSIRAGAVPAAINAPGTLMFIKGYNVWMSRGDGSGQVQITKDGYQSSPYSSPVMDDKGTVAALRGNNVIRMKTDGTPLSVVDVGTLLPIAEGGIQATSGVALSPDGSKIAYDQTSWKIGQSVNVGTRFSASDRWTSAGEQELSRSGPKWITDSRVIVRAWSTLYLRDLASTESVEWFDFD
ncbi:MAG: hypothetical protein GX593_04465, partial [Actinomycetales bacterium]|nr:hypothetical protein [Actinomycetales bacterium]